MNWTGPSINPKLALGWRIPAFSAGDETSAALAVTRELLMSRASPLVRRLIDDDKLALEVYSDTPDRVQPGLMLMVIDLQPGAEMTAVIRAVDEALVSLQAVTPGRVAIARMRLQRQRTIALSGPEGRAQAVGRAALHGAGAQAYAQHTAAIGEVEVSDVKAVLERFLTGDQRTIVSLSSGETP